MLKRTSLLPPLSHSPPPLSPELHFKSHNAAITMQIAYVGNLNRIGKEGTSQEARHWQGKIQTALRSEKIDTPGKKRYSRHVNAHLHMHSISRWYKVK